MMDADFKVTKGWEGDGVIVHLQPELAAALASVLRRYNQHQVTKGLLFDSGWEDLAVALEGVSS